MNMPILSRSPSFLLRGTAIALALAGVLGPPGTVPAWAGIGLSKVIVDLTPDAPPRDDIEVINGGDERQYVVVEPAVIQAPGTPQEKRVDSPDPTVTGLLVTPQKLVLEAGERKLIRVALIVPRDNVERVYRVAVRPVAGSVETDQTALKVFVGYDVLIIARPVETVGGITATRAEHAITFHNGSNTSVEMSDGRQCDQGRQNCLNLPAMRLYAGGHWTVPIEYATPVEYQIQQGKLWRKEVF